MAGNGFRKSAVVKSLYDTFGAVPRKIDASWREARVDSLVEFTIDGTRYAILKALGGFTVFDGDRNPLIRANSVGKDLAPFLARLLDFQLVMTGRNEEITVPPPQYIFAPFYIDQDKWGDPWSSFESMYLANSAQTLAFFHSGLRPNAYYEAMTQRDVVRSEIKALKSERAVLDLTLRSMQTMVSDFVLSYDLEDFKEESERLIAESEQLHAEQLKVPAASHGDCRGNRTWAQQRDLVRKAIAEMDADLADALERPADVACPTCGHHYVNSIVSQFDLVEDKDGLIQALTISTEKLHDLEHKAIAERANIARIQERIDNIKHILGVQKAGVSFRDVIAVEGRNEAVRLIRERLHEKDVAIADKQRLEKDRTESMNSAVSKQRAAEIRDYFYSRLETFAPSFDVRLGGGRKSNITSISLGRGSEGPRGLITYFYAFLHTARRYSSSAFCPIVIDAPEPAGPGRDTYAASHALHRRPSTRGSHTIIATEQLFGLTRDEIDVRDVGVKRNQVLREEEYDRVQTGSAHILISSCRSPERPSSRFAAFIHPSPRRSSSPSRIWNSGDGGCAVRDGLPPGAT